MGKWENHLFGKPSADLTGREGDWFQRPIKLSLLPRVFRCFHTAGQP